MTGSNSNMSLITNVAKDLDGTDPSLSPYTWTCPDVDPYSTIYFYQFTGATDESNPAWTTRFTVCSFIQGSEIAPEAATVDRISRWRNRRPTVQQATQR